MSNSSGKLCRIGTGVAVRGKTSSPITRGVLSILRSLIPGNDILTFLERFSVKHAPKHGNQDYNFSTSTHTERRKNCIFKTYKLTNWDCLQNSFWGAPSQKPFREQHRTIGLFNGVTAFPFDLVRTCLTKQIQNGKDIWYSKFMPSVYIKPQFDCIVCWPFEMSSDIIYIFHYLRLGKGNSVKITFTPLFKLKTWTMLPRVSFFYQGVYVLYCCCFVFFTQQLSD